MHVTKRIDLDLLTRQLAAAAVAVPRGLGKSGTDTDGELYTWDDQNAEVDLPPGAVPVVDAHTAPPLLVEFAAETHVNSLLRTTDGTAHEILRFPCEQKRLYQASLTISGVDAGNFASKIMEGRFTWKRTTGNAIMVGLTIVSDIHDTAAAAWAPNAVPSGTEIVFTVQGAAGRTIDWLLVGVVGSYAPAGVAAAE